MDPRHWNLLSSSRVESLTPPAQFAAYAMAYLDSAEQLCRLLARSHRKATYERGSVVLYLAAHAVELFLKGAILRKVPDESFNHDLEHIHNRYNALYPAKRYRFQIPFRTKYGDLSAGDIMAAKALSRPIDQRFRYPHDKDGKRWPGAHSFEARSFLEELDRLRTSFECLLRAYDG